VMWLLVDVVATVLNYFFMDESVWQVGCRGELRQSRSRFSNGCDDFNNERL